MRISERDGRIVHFSSKFMHEKKKISIVMVILTLDLDQFNLNAEVFIPRFWL